MLTIKFNSVSEFIEELKKEPLARPIVRLTNLYTANERVYPLRSLSVVATAKSHDGDIIRLQTYIGQIWNIKAQDDPLFARAEEVHNKIRAACQELGIEVRPGIYERE